MIRLSVLFIAGLAALATAVPGQEFRAGLMPLSVPDADGPRDLEGFVWYPTTSDAPVTTDFESKVWQGNPVVRDAPAADGVFPLIVLSHGMFGNARNQAWFAGAMAQRGYAVIAFDHPGTSTWSRDPDARRQLWERPRDVSRVIDFAVGSAALPVAIDAHRVFVAGHSLGGFTGAALAGARFDADHLDRVCEGLPGELACGIFDAWDIAKTPADRAQMEADLSDPRIRAFALFDLGGTQGFVPDSLRAIDRPILAFGAPIMNSGLTLDIESRALVAALPPATTRYVEPETLSHFDFLGVCTPIGYALLAEEEPGDEVVCDNGGDARAQKHAMIVDEVARFFADH